MQPDANGFAAKSDRIASTEVIRGSETPTAGEISPAASSSPNLYTEITYRLLGNDLAG